MSYRLCAVSDRSYPTASYCGCLAVPATTWANPPTPPPTAVVVGPALWWFSFAAAVVTVEVYYLVFQGKNIFTEPLTSSDIFLFGEFQDSVSQSLVPRAIPSEQFSALDDS